MIPGITVRTYTRIFQYMRYKYTQMPPTHREGLTKSDRFMRIGKVLQVAEADIIK